MANVYGTNGDDKITATETSRTAWHNGSVDGYFALPGYETLFEGKVTVEQGDNSWTTEVGQFWAGDPDRDGHRDYVADIQAANGDDYVEIGKKFEANVDAGSGNDWVKIHSGSVIGGSGTDILDVSGFTSGATIDLRDTGTDVDRNATFNDDGTITYRTDIEGVVGTSGNDTVYLGAEGGIASTGAGNDSVYGDAGDDFIQVGAVGEGQDVVATGGGWDTVYLGKLGDTDGSFVDNAAHFSVFAQAKGKVNAPDSDPGWTRYEELDGTSELDVIYAIPKFGKYPEFAGTLYEYLRDIINSSDPGYNDPDDSSFTRVTDFDFRYDQLVTPMLRFDNNTPNFENGELVLSLDAENGGKYLELAFSQDLIDEFRAAMNLGSGTTDDEIRKSLAENLWESRIAFTKDESGNVSAQQGSIVVTDQDLLDDIGAALENGTSISIIGNALGTRVNLGGQGDRFAAGSAQDDRFGTSDSAAAGSKFYVAGFEGDDMVSVGHDKQHVVFDGGAGADVVSFAETQQFDQNGAPLSSGVTVDMSKTSSQGVLRNKFDGTGAYDTDYLQVTLTNVEGVEGTNSADHLIGSASDDWFSGLGGNDTVEGNDGHDVLYGGDGRDSLTGGAGHDDLYGGNAADYLDGGAGNDVLHGDDGYTYTNDTLIGGEGRDELFGGNGADQLYGGAGNDSLWAGDGVWDMADGGTGDDVLYVSAGLTNVEGGDGTDMLTYNFLKGGYGAITFDMSQEVTAAWADDGTAFRIDYANDGWRHSFASGIENVTGTEHGDSMTGNAANNTLRGAGGNDTINGGGGNDTLEGGNGNNVLRGGSGNDLVLGGWDADTLTGGEGNDTLDGWISSDVINGGRGNDWINGHLHNDTINGGAGNDTIRGGQGANDLTGGGGADTFVFDGTWASSTVNDFTSEDELLFEGATSESDLTLLYSGDVITEIEFGDTSVHLGADSILTRDTFGSTVTDDGLVIEMVETTTTSTGTIDGTVICTHMHKHGYIPDDVYQWDQHYGANVLGQTIIRGYHAWAIPFVRNVLERSPLATRVCAPMAQAWAQEMAHRCDPAQHPKGSACGKAILAIGVPLCWGIGTLLCADRAQFAG